MTFLRHAPGLFATVLLLATAWPAPHAHAVPSGCAAAPPECVALGGFTGDTFALADWSGVANNSPNVTLRNCTFSNAPAAAATKTYEATATGTGTPGGVFTLSGPGGDLPYEVAINDGSGFVTLVPGVPETFNALTETQYNSCTNNANSSGGQRLRVRVLGANAQSFAAGTYTGTLDLESTSPDLSSSASQTSGPISITLPELVRISAMSLSYSFGNWNPDVAGDLVRFDNSICIWSNHASSDYLVTATTGSGAFDVESGTDAIAFSVYWSDQAGVSTVAASDVQLAYAIPQTLTSVATAVNCAGSGNTASLVLAIAAADIADATPGSYSATLDITIGVAP